MLQLELEFEKKRKGLILEMLNELDLFDLHNLHDCDAVKKISKTILNEHDER